MSTQFYVLTILLTLMIGQNVIHIYRAERALELYKLG